jgi:sporulation protein YlmC with PRC-barrel domain
MIGWRGRKMVDRDGARIGTIEDVFVDDREEGTSWATVKTGRLGRTVRLLPIGDARQVKSKVEVPFAASQVETAPEIGADGNLTMEGERRLVAHYAVAAPTPAATPAARDDVHIQGPSVRRRLPSRRPMRVPTASATASRKTPARIPQSTGLRMCHLELPDPTYCRIDADQDRGDAIDAGEEA